MATSNKLETVFTLETRELKTEAFTCAWCLIALDWNRALPVLKLLVSGLILEYVQFDTQFLIFRFRSSFGSNLAGGKHFGVLG